MKLTHTIKFPLGRQYEMREITIEVDDSEFPELTDFPLTEKTRFMEGFLLEMGLAFQVASGYVRTDSVEFRESLRLAREIKGKASDKIRRPDAQVKTRS